MNIARPRRGSNAASLLAAIAAGLLPAVASAADHPQEPALLAQRCLRCHDAKEQEGGFRLDTLSRDFSDMLAAQKWAEVMTRINAGEMPPEPEPPLTVDEIATVVGWIDGRIKSGEAARLAARGPVSVYRLSREEWGNTVYDLLGVRIDVNARGLFDEDPRWHGFERVGGVLNMAPSHVEKYLRAADLALGRAFPDSEPQRVKIRKTGLDLGLSLIDHHTREKERARVQEAGLADKIRLAVVPGWTRPALKQWWDPRLKQPGVWKCRIQVSGLPSLDGRPPHLAIGSGFFDADIVAREDKPQVVEFEALLNMPLDLEFTNEVPGGHPVGHASNVTMRPTNWFVSSRDTRFLHPTGYKFTDDEGRAIKPLLLIDWIEWEGPIVTDAEKAAIAGLIPKNQADAAATRDCLRRFVERAWRRPVADAELDRYLAIVSAEQSAGEPFRKAWLSAISAVMASKNFLFLVEGSPEQPRDRLDDFELASRLSYFLWGSMPDEPLFEAARAGRLRDRAGRGEQASRMTSDPKINRFLAAFPRQWLQLHRVGMFPPDPGLFPGYDLWLERSMKLETTSYFQRMFEDDRPIVDFLDSDWTMVTPRLAEHYGLPLPETTGVARVTLAPEHHRGGLLTQAAILSLSSDGTRHRPVHRGVWLSEAIFGTTPPPPPPNVEPLPPASNSAAKATVRSLLEAHSTQAACAACHRKIDPYGLAFDNFDAIGRWRTSERLTVGTGADPPVRSDGVLPDGRRFAGPDEFKKLLAADVDRFAEAFVGNLATFALRRTMTVDDADEIRAIAAAAKADGYRLRSIVLGLVRSDLFDAR